MLGCFGVPIYAVFTFRRIDFKDFKDLSCFVSTGAKLALPPSHSPLNLPFQVVRHH